MPAGTIGERPQSRHIGWYVEAWKKFAVFRGRASRQEYWMFVLFNFVVTFVLGLVDATLSNQNGVRLLVGIYALAVIIPSLAAAVRRMHDTGHRGWWLLVPVVNLIFGVSEGERHDNSYGPNPWGFVDGATQRLSVVAIAAVVVLFVVIVAVVMGAIVISTVSEAGAR
jgi:uncharacterized membrane protein YhaH (DUF805 family)